MQSFTSFWEQYPSQSNPIHSYLSVRGKGGRGPGLSSSPSITASTNFTPWLGARWGGDHDGSTRIEPVSSGTVGSAHKHCTTTAGTASTIPQNM